MDKNKEYIAEIMASDSFDRETFQSMARQYFTEDKPEIIEDFLKRQYVCEDISEVIETHGIDNVIDFLNRLIASKDEYQNMSRWEKEKLCIIPEEELDEFMRLASETAEIPVSELAKTSPPLTGRSFLEMMRIAFDASAIWKYPPDTSTAFLYSEARMMSRRDAFRLLKDPDSIEEFAGNYQVLYHNEEIWFGGPLLIIHDESARLERGYTYAYQYTEWTGYVCTNGDNIAQIYRAIKLYTALRKKGYPLYYHGAAEDRDKYLKELERVHTENDALIEWSKDVERRYEEERSKKRSSL
jgi:hypothetical protein